jgi:hypothetical protein
MRLPGAGCMNSCTLQIGGLQVEWWSEEEGLGTVGEIWSGHQGSTRQGAAGGDCVPGLETRARNRRIALSSTSALLIAQPPEA